MLQRKGLTRIQRRVRLTLLFYLSWQMLTLASTPTLGTISPSSGTSVPDTAKAFTCTYSDASGWTHLKEVYLLISTSSSALANSAYLYYDQNTNLLYVRNDANNAWLGGKAPASSNTIENSYVKLNCASTTVSGSGNTLTVKWNVTFKASYSGKSYYSYLSAKDDAGTAAGWVQKGIYIKAIVNQGDNNVRLLEMRNEKEPFMPRRQGMLTADAAKAWPLQYAPNQMIVKLKEGKTVKDIKGLNKKYNITSIGKVFRETNVRKENLNLIENRLSKLIPEHQSWYRQLDKNSQEFKDYVAKLKQEREQLQERIEAQEAVIAKLELRQTRAPQFSLTPTLDNIYILRTNSDIDVLQMAAEYSENPAVEYAEPNYIVKTQDFPQTLPNDTYIDPDIDGIWAAMAWGQDYEDMWGLKKINADEAWPISQGEGIVVAVIDTGIDYNHIDITDNIWINTGEIPDNTLDDDGNGYVDDIKGYDFANNDKDPMDGYGHGTHASSFLFLLTIMR